MDSLEIAEINEKICQQTQGVTVFVVALSHVHTTILEANKPAEKLIFQAAVNTSKEKEVNPRKFTFRQFYKR